MNCSLNFSLLVFEMWNSRSITVYSFKNFFSFLICPSQGDSDQDVNIPWDIINSGQGLIMPLSSVLRMFIPLNVMTSLHKVKNAFVI